MGLTSNIKDNDFVSIRQAIAKLGSIKFGPTSLPTFAGLTLTGLDASEFVFTNASKELSSVNVPLVVAYGGTGATTLTDHSILLGSGTNAFTALGAATNGQLPIGSTGADPVLATITGTANQITVTNGAGSIALSLPDAVAIGSTDLYQATLRLNNDSDACRIILDVVGLPYPDERQSWGIQTDRAVRGDFEISRGTSGDTPLTSVLYADHDGNIGIGKYAPGTLLDVNGEITSTDLTLSAPSNVYSLSHDSFADFDADEHFLQTTITNVSTALSTGLLKVTTGTGALSVITDSSSNWDDAYTHISESGASHVYINQDVQTTASPAFAGLTVTNCCVLGSDSAVFQPNSDSTTFFQVNQADGTVFLNGDSTNGRVGIRTNSPGYPLEVPWISGDSTHTSYFGSFDVNNNQTAIYAESHIDIAVYARSANNYAYYGSSNNAVAAYFRRYRNVDDITPVLRLGREAASGTPSTGLGGSIDFYLSNSLSQEEETCRIVGRFTDATDGAEKSALCWYTRNVSVAERMRLDYLGQLEIFGPTPYTILHNDTHEDADGGRESRLNFKGEQSGGEETTLARIEASHDGAADDQKGWWGIYTNDGSDGDSPTLRMSIDSAGATDVVGDFTAGTIQADDGVSGTLELDDGSTEKITLVFTGGILTSRTVAATTGSVLADWTD